MVPGTVNELSAHDRMILDFERSPSSADTRVILCRRIELAVERYPAVLDGLADTDAAFSYAPDVVTRIRRLRSERFAFERRKGRWRSFMP
ncbi:MULTISPECIES: DUF3263 domain-containing protein [unclassified Brevibacterium]|uniref:DUF3263 domain-containing protein n=1 Tax=unclassified Brevibacterium TaxID=2614124 RepID=UPI0010F73247|nr:DUF3263 domain-containing protein [Brevibacterium sp. 2SA]MCM1014155.1 DUF3263 domain-containing protein [Brevibacterium sp. XM4083]